jgi:hypothetical protein
LTRFLHRVGWMMIMYCLEPKTIRKVLFDRHWLSNSSSGGICPRKSASIFLCLWKERKLVMVGKDLHWCQQEMIPMLDVEFTSSPTIERDNPC